MSHTHTRAPRASATYLNVRERGGHTHAVLDRLPGMVGMPPEPPPSERGETQRRATLYEPAPSESDSESTHRPRAAAARGAAVCVRRRDVSIARLFERREREQEILVPHVAAAEQPAIAHREAARDDEERVAPLDDLERREDVAWRGMEAARFLYFLLSRSSWLPHTVKLMMASPTRQWACKTKQKHACHSGTPTRIAAR